MKVTMYSRNSCSFSRSTSKMLVLNKIISQPIDQIIINHSYDMKGESGLIEKPL
jgi:glutaredoxin